MKRGITRLELLHRDFSEVPAEALEILHGKTLLVTGCTGLIGSLLAKLAVYANDAIENDSRVICVHRNESKVKAILPELTSRDDVAFLQCDLAKDSITYDGHIDYIVHAAGVTSSIDMLNRPAEVITTSVMGTKSALALAKTTGAKLLYLSSMEVYGALTNGENANESTLGLVDTMQVRSCYPESKRLCENLCVSYAAQYGVNVCVARLAATTGVGVSCNDKRALTQFIKVATRGENILLKTSGRSELNNVYTSDVLHAILILLDSGESMRAYNVANPDNHTTIKELAERVAQSFGVRVHCQEEPQSSFYAPETHLRMSIDAMKAIGWRPTIDLNELIKRVGKWLITSEADRDYSGCDHLREAD